MSAPVPGPPPRRDPDEVPVADLEAQVRALDDLADRPVGEHHDRLAAVHESLHAALNEQPPSS